MRAKAQIHIFTVNTDGNVNFNLSLNLSNLEIDESDPFWGPHFYHVFSHFFWILNQIHFGDHISITCFFTFFLDSKSDPFSEPHFYHIFFTFFLDSKSDPFLGPHVFSLFFFEKLNISGFPSLWLCGHYYPSRSILAA